ncbi:MAG: transcription antitermination factor NusB [Tannerellaceae bacterium]|jgi:N utilization substance protein B|nr:transcription antitermination factor NusB [Tannerellaceae bacterium]
MINRTLIRIKILQIIYAYYQNGAGDLKAAEKDLLFSLRKSYDLYHYFLLLIIALTNLQERILDGRMHKYMPTDEELHPNMRLVNNRFARQLELNEGLQHYVNEYKISWDNDRDFLRGMLDTLLASDLYAAYLDDPDDSYDTDREFWRTAFRTFVCGNESFNEYLEDKSIFWNDDVDIVGTFTLKTIKLFSEREGSRQTLIPMFNNEETREFALTLFRESLLHGAEIRERIGRHMQNWETERVANLDLIIMQLAVAELMAFPSIPVSVSLNEYIDMAKYYSTPKSGTFINGILSAIVDELKKEKVLFKD